MLAFAETLKKETVQKYVYLFYEREFVPKIEPNLLDTYTGTVPGPAGHQPNDQRHLRFLPERRPLRRRPGQAGLRRRLPGHPLPHDHDPAQAKLVRPLHRTIGGHLFARFRRWPGPPAGYRRNFGQPRRPHARRHGSVRELLPALLFAEKLRPRRKIPRTHRPGEEPRRPGRPPGRLFRRRTSDKDRPRTGTCNPDR